MAAAVCAKYKSMKSGDPDAFLKWLYNAAKIEIKLFYRKQQRSIKTFHGDYDMVDYSMDDLLDAIGKPSTIKVLYSKLNQNERELFRLRIIGHNTYAQLADILGKTEGSLMTAVSRLLKKCQKIIQEHENLL